MAQEGAEIPNGFVQVNFLAGFVIADTKTCDASPRALVKMANAIMVPVGSHGVRPQLHPSIQQASQN